MKGSPFLSDQWAKGTVKFLNDSVSKPIDLKFDLVGDIVLFKNEKEETLELVEPIKEFTITYLKDGFSSVKLFRSGFKPINENTVKSYYEVLSDGKIIFVKRIIKTIMEEAGYNSAQISKTFIEKPYYYIVKDNLPLSVKLNLKDIVALLPDKATELNDYSKKNKLNLKDQIDVAKLISFYNSL